MAIVSSTTGILKQANSGGDADETVALEGPSDRGFRLQSTGALDTSGTRVRGIGRATAGNGPASAAQLPRLAEAPFPVEQTLEVEYRANLSDWPTLEPPRWRSDQALEAPRKLDSPEALVIDLLDRFYLRSGPRSYGAPTGHAGGVFPTPMRSRFCGVTHAHTLSPESLNDFLSGVATSSDWGDPSGRAKAFESYFHGDFGRREEQIRAAGARFANLQGAEFSSPDEFSQSALTSADPDRYTRELKPSAVVYATDDANPREVEREAIDRLYIVGHEFESATYYDTPTRQLSQRGVALREKRFGGGPRDGKELVTDSRCFCAKVTYADQGRWTRRREIAMQIPYDAPPADADTGLAYLLHQVASDIDAATLVPRVRIDNNRYKINLHHLPKDAGTSMEDAVKIGFVTLDVYTPVLLDAAGKEVPCEVRPQIQMEVEILATHQTPEITAATATLITELEKTYGFTPSPAPKAERGLDALGRARRDS